MAVKISDEEFNALNITRHDFHGDWNYAITPRVPSLERHQRMIDDMTARRFSEATRRDYVRHVRNFAAFLGRSPDTATSEDLRRFQLHMAQQRIGAATVDAAVAALRFFCKVTLERPDLVRHLTTVRERRKAPIVLNQC